MAPSLPRDAASVRARPSLAICARRRSSGVLSAHMNASGTSLLVVDTKDFELQLQRGARAIGSDSLLGSRNVLVRCMRTPLRGVLNCENNRYVSEIPI